MLTSRLVARILSAGLMALSAGVACGQGYPAKLIRVITAEAGGSSDLVSRLISHELSAGLGQQVIVENRGGPSGVIAAETFAKARPDGYTLLLYSTGIWILPLMQKVPYDPVRDFSPITLATMAPNILVVKEKFASIGVETVGNSPEEFAATIAADMSRMGKVIKDAGIRSE